MQYLGSKNRICKHIIPIIQQYINENNIDTFIDCFVGGANVSDKIKCGTIIGNDLSPTLIALHKQAQENFDILPESTTKEEWLKYYDEFKKIKAAIANKEPLPQTEDPYYLIGAIEWWASFSKGGFNKGFANNSSTRNYFTEARNNHKKQAESKIYQSINFIQGDYLNLISTLEANGTDLNHAILYCDSPYKNTTGYGINPNFNFDIYYNWLREMSKRFPIFISESYMPDDFACVWFKEVNRTNGLDNTKKATEKLFFIDNR